MSNTQIMVGLGAAAIGGLFLMTQNTGKARYKDTVKEEKKDDKRNAKYDGDLLEYSVVYTDRAKNLMAASFTQAMQDISGVLKRAYNADACVLIPGSGTYAMEAVARQFGTGKRCLVIRNGYFSFRWSDIFQKCKLPSEEIVLKARAIPGEENSKTPYFAPCPLEEVIQQIKEFRPEAVFAPHVETATGMLLKDDYMRRIADAVHEVGGVFIIDSIASGCVWVDMEKSGVDVLISAPQKAWSAPACVGITMLNKRAKELVKTTDPGSSFTVNLQAWLNVMELYEGGGFKYYTTLPTDALVAFRDAAVEMESYGFAKARDDMFELGSRVRAALEKRGMKSVAAPGWQSPGVVVSYADNPNMVGKFKAQGLQIAGGVPFKIGEPEGLMTFRLGLFGLDKIGNVDRCVRILEDALDGMPGASRL